MGTACAECLLLTRQGWPLKEWQEILLLNKTVPEFALEINEARKVLQGTSGKRFLAENVASSTLVGFSVERVWSFLKLDQFMQRFGEKPEALGLQVDTLSLDATRSEKGILILDDDNIKVRSFHTTQLGIEGLVFDNAKQLRAGQGTDIWRHAAGAKQDVPKCFAKPETGLTAEAISKKAKELQEKKRKEEEDRAAAEAALPKAPPGQEPQGDECDSEIEQEEEEEEEVVENSAAQNAVLFLPEGLAASKKRRKESSFSNNQGSACRRRLSEVLSESDKSDAMTESGRSGDASLDSCAHSSTLKKNSIARAMEKARDWVRTLPLTSVLNKRTSSKGCAWGKLHWQATATKDCVEKAAPGCADVVVLKNHLELVKIAEAH